MNSSLTPTSYAILGLLGIRDWTTYELAKQVQRSLSWFWPRTERKLYDEPKRLVAEGLATATAESTGKRPRTVYAITRQGRREMRQWLGQPSASRTTEFEAMLKVFFANQGTLDQLRATLERIREEAAERLERLGELSVSTSATTPYPERAHINALSTRMQLEQELGYLRWSSWALEQVATWNAADDPGAWDWRAVFAEIVEECREAVDVTAGATTARGREVG